MSNLFSPLWLNDEILTNCYIFRDWFHYLFWCCLCLSFGFHAYRFHVGHHWNKRQHNTDNLFWIWSLALLIFPSHRYPNDRWWNKIRSNFTWGVYLSGHYSLPWYNPDFHPCFEHIESIITCQYLSSLIIILLCLHLFLSVLGLVLILSQLFLNSFHLTALVYSNLCVPLKLSKPLITHTYPH